MKPRDMASGAGLARGAAPVPWPFRRKLAEPLRALSGSPPLAIAFGMLLCVAVGDYFTGPYAIFTLLYLAPIGFGTWFAGLRAGVVFSVLSAVTSLVTDLASSPDAEPHNSAVIQAWNLFVQLGVFLALTVLLDALRSRLLFEQQLARTDSLTQVSNRRAFLEATAQELERTRRHPRPITVAYLDCDDFKRVNDLFGHEGGDALLQTVASTLRRATRALDSVARLGGDEFGLLLPETDATTAEQLLGRLRATLAAAIADGGWEATFSIGVVTFLGPPSSVDDMIGRADRLMYEAKRAGKNGIRFEVLGQSVSGLAGAA